MTVGVFPIVAIADNSEVVIIAGSDFRDPDDKKDTTAPASSANVKTILNQIKKNHPSADGLIFCGGCDKDIPSGNVANSTTALKNALPFLSFFTGGIL